MKYDAFLTGKGLSIRAAVEKPYYDQEATGGEIEEIEIRDVAYFLEAIGEDEIKILRDELIKIGV